MGGSSFQYGFLFLNTPAYTLKDQVRSIILAILLFASFLCWANTIRYANHLSYCIGGLEVQIKLVENREAQEEQARNARLDIEAGNGQENVESDPRSTHSTVGNVIHKEVPSLLPDLIAHRHRTVEEVLEGLKVLSVSMLSSFSLGFRFLFVAIPFGFYSAGPLALIIASAVILIFLFNIDHVEKSTYNFMAGFSHHTHKSV